MAGQDEHLLAAIRAASTTRDVRIAAGALGAIPVVLRQSAPAVRYVVVADDHTWKVAGGRVASLLAESGLAVGEPVLLTGQPRVKASAETARALATTIKATGALPIAVGSGVISDLVKYAAEIAGTPYVCMPTAASLDGYAPSGAALRDDGFTRTFACAAPIAIVAYLDVISTAPAAMAGWGYGDLVNTPAPIDRRDARVEASIPARCHGAGRFAGWLASQPVPGAGALPSMG